MKTFFAISNLLVLALSSPLPAYSHLPTLRLRTIGPDTTHYIPSSQNPSINGHIITLPIGAALSSLAQSPLLLQGVEIVDVEIEGDVYCRANVGYSSKGVVVRKGEGVVMLDEGKGGIVMVTELSCGVGHGINN
jgi:hypothetical protein